MVATDFQTRFTQRLAQLDAQEGFSQRDLAARVGCSPSLVTHWVKGTRTPSVTMLERLAAAVGLGPEELEPTYAARLQTQRPVRLSPELSGLVLATMNATWSAMQVVRSVFLQLPASAAVAESGIGKDDTRGFDAICEGAFLDRMSKFDERSVFITEERGLRGHKDFAAEILFLLDPVDRSKHLMEDIRSALRDDPTAASRRLGDLLSGSERSGIECATFSVTCVMRGRISFSFLLNLVTGDVYCACAAFVRKAMMDECPSVETLALRGEPIDFGVRDGDSVLTYLGGAEQREERRRFARDLGVRSEMFGGEETEHEPGGPGRILALEGQEFGHAWILGLGEKIPEWIGWVAFALFSRQLAVFELFPAAGNQLVYLKNGVLATPPRNYSILSRDGDGLVINLRRLMDLENPAHYRSAIAVAHCESQVTIRLESEFTSQKLIG